MIIAYEPYLDTSRIDRAFFFELAERFEEIIRLASSVKRACIYHSELFIVRHGSSIHSCKIFYIISVRYNNEVIAGYIIISYEVCSHHRSIRYKEICLRHNSVLHIFFYLSPHRISRIIKKIRIICPLVSEISCPFYRRHMFLYIHSEKMIAVRGGCRIDYIYIFILNYFKCLFP